MISINRRISLLAVGLLGCLLVANSCKDMGHDHIEPSDSGEFSASKPIVDLGPGQQDVVLITGGRPPYVILALPDTNLVSVTLTNSGSNSATLTLLAASSIASEAVTSIKIRDTHEDDSPTHEGDTLTVVIRLHSVLIPIATPNAVTVGPSATVDVQINGGTLPYQIVSPPNPAYATAVFQNANSNPAILHITGVSVASVSGSTFVKVKGSASSPVDTVRIQITKIP